MNKYKIDAVTGCWVWIGAIGASGYGVAHLAKHKTKCAHRFIYENTKGQIPNGLELDHLCFNKRCVNPAHLEPVTHRENVRRYVLSPLYQHRISMPRSLRAVCKNGHPLDGIRTRPGNGRYCKICVKFSKRRQRAKTKAPLVATA